MDTIRHLFGGRVAEIVKSCSDSTVSDPKKKLGWRKRKEIYLAHLRKANKDTATVSAADKLHNARAILSDYREVGEKLWKRFNASKKSQLWYYGQLVKALQETAAPKELVAELERVVNKLNEKAK